MTVKRSLEIQIKTMRRGGNFIVDLFGKYRLQENKEISGTDCMSLLNYYGLSDCEIYTIAFSHGLTCNWDEFNKLKKEDDESMANAIHCDTGKKEL